MISKLKCIKNSVGFTKDRVYNLVENVDENDWYVELYDDNSNEVPIELPDERFEVIK